MSGQPDPTPESLIGPQGIERRVATRHVCNLATSCRLLAAVRSAPESVRVRNISVTGISLVASRYHEPESHVEIELRNVARRFSRTIRVRVIYCIDHPSGESIVGGHFTDVLSEDELRLFVG